MALFLNKIAAFCFICSQFCVSFSGALLNCSVFVINSLFLCLDLVVFGYALYAVVVRDLMKGVLGERAYRGRGKGSFL